MMNEIDEKNNINFKKPPFQRSSYGTRYPLISEGKCQVCRIAHQKSILQKIVNSKPLRKWETHTLILSESNVTSANPRGYMTYGIAFTEIAEVLRNVQNGTKPPYTIHFVLPRFGSILLQFNSAYERDQWYFSIYWKITSSRIRKLYTKIKKKDELLHELKELVTTCVATPISDNSVFQLPLNSISSLLLGHGHEINEALRVDIIKATAPILSSSCLPPAMCKCFQRITKNQKHTSEISEVFLPPVEKILKHNTDFGKFPHLRILVQDFLCALSVDDKTNVSEFIQNLHTANMTCPHPRVLPNLVTVSLAAIYSVYENDVNEESKNVTMSCFITVFKTICSFKDWVQSLAVLLQAVPFPKESLKDKKFKSFLAEMIQVFADDKNCDVHQSILPIREEKDGWVHHFAPGGTCCEDDGALFSSLMSKLIPCCCKRKKMLVILKANMLGLFTLMALRGDKFCIEALVSLLDFDLMNDEEENLEIIAALQSSEEGKRQYEELCTKREEFANMKQSGGPHKLTLPSQSTDEDLIHLLKSGSFGNLQSLNLAFTCVTSDAAQYIIKLPSLRHLNLWATQFDDRGLILISEHLPKLESLNLCETSVSDEGLMTLGFLRNLQILNLNSTKLSALTYETLKEKLRELKVVDLRYTEAF